ncbi:hypothetical protein LTR36_009369 [Oleoguttula mirabilis]|uniref:F-box domain-containing protein n=1 Tax=Oleoguttula mirabilis TaxID=1507867 RepID=A0AAV9JSG3_9PEZI|nr:hypothetical protein LTR36_009369 [Oleoguttula mirabilis]
MQAQDDRDHIDFTKMKTTILDLPSELIASIVAYLPDKDVFATRQANSQLERASLSHFGKRFFRKKGYMLTTPSLSVLQHIADHAELRKYVQHVWFNPDLYTFVHPDCAPDREEMPDPDNPDSLLDLLAPSDRKKYVAYQECKEDHVLLVRNCGAKLATVLTEAFAKLPNLETIGMRRSEDHRPWGWSRLRDAVGEDPRVLGPIPSGPLHFLSGPTRLFIAIINAVAATDTRLRRLYTDAIEIDNIRPDLLPQEILDKACGSIWYLETNITKGWLNRRKVADYTTIQNSSEYGKGLVRLLRATSALKEVGLQIFQVRQQSPMEDRDYHDPSLWRRSYSFLCVQQLTSSDVQLKHLTRFKLERIAASPSLLLAFLAPSQACLTSLKLRDVRLVGNERNPRPWKSIFEFLRDSCPQLDYILLYQLLYHLGSVSFGRDRHIPHPPANADPTTATPNPPHGQPVGGEPFKGSKHLTVRVHGKEAVHAKLGDLVEQHWYHKPTFTLAMDEELWHTDTSDEEW